MSIFQEADYEQFRLNLNEKFFPLHRLGDIEKMEEFVTDDYDIILKMEREKPLYGFFKNDNEKLYIILEDVLFFDEEDEITQYIEIVKFDTINMDKPEAMFTYYIPEYQTFSFKNEKEPSNKLFVTGLIFVISYHLNVLYLLRLL